MKWHRKPDGHKVSQSSCWYAMSHMAFLDQVQKHLCSNNHAHGIAVNRPVHSLASNIEAPGKSTFKYVIAFLSNIT